MNGVVGFRYNNTDYYYVKNVQGDVLAIYNASGTKVASYIYDAWGRNYSILNYTPAKIGDINPFRYRSYYYDVETGLYYLQTRYYDPEVGRFINSDALEYLGDGDELSNYNLFAYCGNNPVLSFDPEGTFLWHVVAGAAIGALIGAASSIISDVLSGDKINITNALISAGTGAVSGVLASCGLPSGLVYGVDIALSGVESIATGLINDYTKDKKINDVGTVVTDTVFSMGFTALFSLVGGGDGGKKVMDMYDTAKTATKKLKAKGKCISNLAKKNLEAIKKSYLKKVVSDFPGDLFNASFQECCSSVSETLYKGIFNYYFGE